MIPPKDKTMQTDGASGASPAALYQARLDLCEADAQQLGRRHVLLSYLRLLWALAIVVLAWFVFARHALAWEWFLLPCLGFGFTARLHARVLAAGARRERAKAWNAHGLSRLEDRWAGVRPRTPDVDTSSSLYAADLDLFSPGGLFELLCTARTNLGENTLAAWLLQPAAADEIRARQAAVAELRDQTELREALASAPGADLVKLNAAALAGWGEARETALPGVLLWISPLLVLLTIGAAARWIVTHSPLLLILMVAINWVVLSLLQGRLKPLFSAAEQASQALNLIADLLAELERRPFAAPLLQEFKARVQTGQEAAWHATSRLARLAGAIEQRSNGFIRLLDYFFLYSVFLGLRVESWRRSHGARLRTWFEVMGAYEALLSLSTYLYEHPADTFPELVGDAAVFEAEALGHPLLPERSCVRNSLALDGTIRLILVSGSNMSGKSTLLRSVGTAAVMGMAGAPVRAERLRLSSLHVAASIQVNDSLQGGQSRFFAEILRLRAICDLARTQPPVLFLLDELLAGTNSHDRLAGASGVVKELLGADAIGLLSTHDLALTGVAGTDAPLIRNVHLEDKVEGDRLTFDYTLREGVVTRSNGLALMRLIGLDV